MIFGIIRIIDTCKFDQIATDSAPCAKKIQNLLVEMKLPFTSMEGKAKTFVYFLILTSISMSTSLKEESKTCRGTSFGSSL